jgi:hypothetical protein
MLFGPCGATARGDKEAEGRYPASGEQITQLGELVPPGVTDPNTDDDRFSGVGESNCFGNLWQRGHVDYHDIALLGKPVEHLSHALTIEEVELVHLFLACEQELQP